NAVIDGLEADGIGVEHGPATIARESVARRIDDIDIAGAKSNTFRQDVRTLIDHRIETAFAYFRGARLALRHAETAAFGVKQFDDFLVDDALAVLIAVVTAPDLLPEPAALGQHCRRPVVGGVVVKAIATRHAGEVADVD